MYNNTKGALSRKPEYPVGNVPSETVSISDTLTVVSAEPTVVPTATPAPTPVPTAEPMPVGAVAKSITVETIFKPGVYRVGIDIEPGKYVFTGTGAADIYYDSPTSDFIKDMYKTEGCIWKAGDFTAITLKNGTFFKIKLNDVKIKPYEFSLAEGEEKLFAVGTYHVGEDIPAGKYYFTGTDAADILYSCPNDEFADGTYEKEGSIWKAGDFTTIDLKEGTYFKITLHEVLIKHFDLVVPDSGETMLAVGSYHVGTDIPAGKYKLVGTDAADIFYNCKDDQFAEGTYTKEGSIWKQGDTVVLDLKEGTYFKITLHEIMISKFVAFTDAGSEAEIPVGVYLIGVDIPAGKYKVTGTGAADLYYDCPDDLFTSGTYKKDGSIWSVGDTTSITLKDNTYLQITLHAVKLKQQ